MYIVEITMTGVKNKQYVKSIEGRVPVLGSLKEAEPLSYECALQVKKALESELTCGKAQTNIITDFR